jgi:hypothetical protein
MRRAARLKTLAHRADPFSRATQPIDKPPQDDVRPRSSDLAAPAQAALGGRELDRRWMSYAAGRSRDVNRRERRRTEQTGDEREWQKALAVETHDFSGLLKLDGGLTSAAIRDSRQSVRQPSHAAKSSLRGRCLNCRRSRAGTLIAAATITTSFFGGQALRHHVS